MLYYELMFDYARLCARASHEGQGRHRDIDVVCVYDPTGQRCYYVDPKQFGGSISLRVEPTRNGQQRNVLSADAFTKVPANLLAPTD